MININLLPPELKMKRIAAKRNASLISICVAIILGITIIGIIGRSVENTVQTNLNSAKDNIEKDNTDLGLYQDLIDTALFINDRSQTTDKIDEKRVYWSQIIQDLINCVPTNVQLKNVAINADKTPNFVLQGNTVSERDIIKFKEKLEDSILFKNVTFKNASVSQGQGPNTNKVDFTLEFDLEANKLETSTS